MLSTLKSMKRLKSMAHQLPKLALKLQKLRRKRKPVSQSPLTSQLAGMVVGVASESI